LSGRDFCYVKAVTAGQIDVRYALFHSSKNIFPAVAVGVYFIAEGVLF
jgi:hypothetical protein